MREYRLSGSVEGVVSDRDSYSDHGLCDEKSAHSPRIACTSTGTSNRRTKARARALPATTSDDDSASDR